MFCWLRLFLPLVRKILPHHTSTYIEKTQQLGISARVPYLHVFRKLILAYERKKLITKIFRKSMFGSLCLCDRYPLDNKFLTDGSTFSDSDITSEHSKFKRVLMRTEKRIYQTLPRPNLIFFLKVCPKTALSRNDKRIQSYKDETYLLFRHKLLCEVEKSYNGDSSFYTINTETIGEEHCSNFIISSVLRNI
jgi:thymidylate kinase